MRRRRFLTSIGVLLGAAAAAPALPALEPAAPGECEPVRWFMLKGVTGGPIFLPVFPP